MGIHHAAAYFKTVTPRQMIRHTTGQTVISQMDETVLEDLKKYYRLPDEVANVLVQYILLASLTLSHPSLFKIATHWSRLRVETAEQAMLLVKKEHVKYKTLWMTNLLKQKKKPDPFLESLRGAASSNLTDEQLGAYIRALFERTESQSG